MYIAVDGAEDIREVIEVERASLLILIWAMFLCLRQASPLSLQHRLAATKTQAGLALNGQTGSCS